MFDNCIMLVWVQGSPFHIAAGHILYRKPGGHKIQCCLRPYQQISLNITIQKKYNLTYLRRTVSQLLKERLKVKFLALQGSNRSK